METSPGLRSTARFTRNLGFGFQIPVRSGLPSGILGAGAVRIGLPSGVRGTFGVLLASHCPEAAPVKSAATAIVRKLFMSTGIIHPSRDLFRLESTPAMGRTVVQPDGSKDDQQDGWENRDGPERGLCGDAQDIFERRSGLQRIE